MALMNGNYVVHSVTSVYYYYYSQFMLTNHSVNISWSPQVRPGPNVLLEEPERAVNIRNSVPPNVSFSSFTTFKHGISDVRLWPLRPLNDGLDLTMRPWPWRLWPWCDCLTTKYDHPKLYVFHNTQSQSCLFSVPIVLKPKSCNSKQPNRFHYNFSVKLYTDTVNNVHHVWRYFMKTAASQLKEIHLWIFALNNSVCAIFSVLVINYSLLVSCSRWLIHHSQAITWI